MSKSTEPVAAMKGAITGDRQATANEQAPRQAKLVTEPQQPVLITEQQVKLGTAAALRPRHTGIIGLVINAFHGAAALRLPPPRPTYGRLSYLEGARMGREMDRL